MRTNRASPRRRARPLSHMVPSRASRSGIHGAPNAASFPPLIENCPQYHDVYVFVHFQTVKRRSCKSAHPRFDDMIREVKEEFFASASRNVHHVLATGIVDLQSFNGL